MPLTKSRTASRQAISVLYHCGVYEKYMGVVICMVRLPVGVSVAACHQVQQGDRRFFSFHFPPNVAQQIKRNKISSTLTSCCLRI